MLIPILAILVGLALLAWSAERFVDGASATAHHLKVPAIIIGMVIIGFGTSAPEMLVSVLAAAEGNAGIALGNAVGSNIANIGLILAIGALVRPIMIHSRILQSELPVLTVVTALFAWLIHDNRISRLDALTLLLAFAALIGWTVWRGLRPKNDSLEVDAHAVVDKGEAGPPQSLRRSMFWTVAGLAVLVASSRLLVWGAVKISTELGVSDLVIGLTIVAVGTSLPELASTISAARKGLFDMAIGNIIGSNLFNTLAVVGVAGTVAPFGSEREAFTRDMPVLALFTVALFAIGYRPRSNVGRVNRFEATLLILAYVGYTTFLVASMG